MPNKHQLWASLIGDLRVDEQLEEFSQLRDHLARALLPEDAQQLKAKLREEVDETFGTAALIRRRIVVFHV
jgi:hypothetical protein